MVTNRRDFIGASCAVAAAGMFSGTLASGAEFKTKLRKAKIIGPVIESALTPLKEAGFDGVETTQIANEADAARAKTLIEGMGMRVHSVLRGWMEFNSDDAKKVEGSLEATRKALRAAKAYGADAILLVPCRVGGMPMPQPREFAVEFDEKTGHVTRVAKEENAKYEAYIAAQNKATDTSRAAVEKLIPLAEELGVIIGLENVWNNLWVTPQLYKHFVASFANKWVKAYYDIGNHVKYSPPQEWVKVLGPLLCKLHVKDFKLTPDGRGGNFVHPRDGSIDWPAVRQALEDVGYDGWATIEDGGLPLAEFAKRFDLIAAGK
jgi:L-ribulose-5-phosphate 3-epimerase